MRWLSFRLDSYKESGDYVTTYSGTLTKQVQVWESNIVWVSDYIGYYSGTVYKYICGSIRSHSDPHHISMLYI